MVFTGVSWELCWEMWDAYSTVKVLQHQSNAYGYTTCASNSVPVHSMLHVLVHSHNHKKRHFNRQGSGHKFGALGPGLNWAKSVSMQVYWTSGKKEH